MEAKKKRRRQGHRYLLSMLFVVVSTSAQGPQLPQLWDGVRAFPIPSGEGLVGHKDPTAILAITRLSEQAPLDESEALYLEGTLQSSSLVKSGPNRFIYEIQNGFRSRIEVQGETGTSSLSTQGTLGHYHGDKDPREKLSKQQFAGPFPMQPQILELTKSPLATVIDDGVVAIAGMSFHKIKITSPTMYGASTSDLYLDPNTSYLQYLVQSQHNMVTGEFRQQSESKQNTLLRVLQYKDYRKYDNLTLPGTIEEIYSGRIVAVFTIQKVKLLARHEAQYFK